MLSETQKASKRRAFSEKHHTAGKWNSKISSTKNPLVRTTWNYCSYKRSGVNKLASRSINSPLILDLGAGNGVYSHWFLGKTPDSKVVAVDWSYTALKGITNPKKSVIKRVCADIHYLPFKPEIFDIIFSIDTLGHVSHLEKVLNETLRIAKNGANLFLHSECCDYQYRWPDRALIRKNKKDILAEFDGHFSLKTSTHIYSFYNQRFTIKSFFNPAGILGWIIGYPEKYYIGFKEAHMYFFASLTGIFALIKRIPILGTALRLLNAFTNHLEIFLGLNGGGSCFAILEKPNRNRH